MFSSRRLSQRPTAEELEQRNILKRECLNIIYQLEGSHQNQKCIFFILRVVLIIHLDCLFDFWRYQLQSDLLSLRSNGARWRLACGGQSAQKNTFWKKLNNNVSFYGNHDLVTQDNPQTFFCCGQFHVGTVVSLPNYSHQRITLQKGSVLMTEWDVNINGVLLGCAVAVSQLSLVS